MIGCAITRTQAYVRWIARRTPAIFAGTIIVVAAAICLVAFELPLRADLADLLPKTAPSVLDLHRLERRLASHDTVLVIVSASDAATCGSAAAELSAGIRKIGPALVVRADDDQPDARAFLWEHRFVLAPIKELRRAHEALAHRLAVARLAANPLFVDLAPDRTSGDDFERLRTERRDLERELHRPTNLSKDGRRALIEVRAAMPATDVDGAGLLLDALTAARAPVLARYPGLEIGFAGDLVTAIAEHDAILNGTILSSIATTLLVGLVLWLYFRSLLLLGLLVGTIGIATLVAFAAAVFTVGHLNAATAFLGAIIAGNGINYGILLIARFLEERRSRPLEDALARAIAATLQPTAIASLGAAIAYASLAATRFKGFADFAIIGSLGMLLCWIASYLLLPALVLRFGTRAMGSGGPRLLERALVRMFGTRRPGIVLVVGLVITGAAAAIVVRFIAHDPFEYDMRELSSVAEANRVERAWMKLAEASFGRGRAGRTFIAADRAAQVPAIVAALSQPELRGIVGSVQSILDVVPIDQPARLAILGDLRAMLSDDVLDELGEADRVELEALRPPRDVAAVTREMLPSSIKEVLTERDGRIGLLVSVRPAENLDELDGRDLIRFAAAVRSLELANHEVITTSGASVVFADILETIARDGPLVTGLAIAGLAVMLVIVLGIDRRTLAVMVATCCGALAMVAICALANVKVSFLDFVALPVTLGLGVDYGINIAHRHLMSRDPIETLRTSGGAVVICSLTTMIGYASLLISDNLAIRGFGVASLIGEVTAVLAALLLVPAVLAVHARVAR